jgi:hypothetical protein
MNLPMDSLPRPSPLRRAFLFTLIKTKMKTYHLSTIVGDSVMETKVQAEYFDTTTFNSTSSGYYAFKNHKDGKDQLVACYPIDRTIISKIERDQQK